MKEKAQILFTLLIIGSCCCYVIKMSYVNRQKYNIYQNKANVPNFGNLISKRKEFDSDFEFLLDTMQSLDNLKAPSYILCDYWNRLVSRIDLNRELSVIEKNLLLDSANLFMTQLLARSHNSQDKLKIGQQVVYLSSKLPFIMRNTDTLNLVLQVAFIGEQIEFIKQIIEFISNSAINNPKEFNKKISINARSLCILINGFSDSDTNIYSNHSINSNFNIIKMIYNLLPLLKEKNDLNISEKEELFVHNAYLKSIFSSSSTTITNAHGFDIYNYLLQQNKVDSFSLSLALKKCLDTRDYDRCKKLWSTSVEHGCIKQPHRITKSIMVNILCSGILADNHNNKQELSINSFASAIKIIEQDVCDEVLSPLMHSLGCLAIEPSEVLSCLRQLVPLEQDNTINDDANSNNDGPPILSLIQGYLSESATSEVIKTYSLVYHIQDYNVEEGIPSRCITGNTKVLNVLIQAVRLKRIANDDYDLELVKLWQFISNVILKRLEFVQNMKTRLDQRKLVDQYTMASGIELATSMGDSSFAFLFWNKLMKIKFKVSSRIVHALLRSFGSWKRLEGTVTSIDPDVVVEQLSLFRNTIRDLTTYKHFTSIIDNRMIDEACHAALRLNSVDEARRTLDMFRFRARENMKVHSKEKDIRHPSFSGGIMNMLIHVERDWRSSEYLLSDSNNDVVQQLDWISSILVETLPSCRDNSHATVAFATIVSLSLIRGDYNQAIKNLLLVENTQDISTTSVLHLAIVASLDGSLPLLSLKKSHRKKMLRVIESGPTSVVHIIQDIPNECLFSGMKFQNRITATLPDIIEFLEFIVDNSNDGSNGSNSMDIMVPVGISLLQMCFSESIANNRPLAAKKILGILERARLVLDIKDCSSDLTRDDVLADLSDVTVVRARLAQRWTAMLLGNNLRRVSGRLGSDLKGKMELLQRVKTDNANFDD